MSDAIIQMKDVNKWFGEFQVLKNGDFIRLIIKSVNLNETIGWMPLSIQDLNNLFGKN